MATKEVVEYTPPSWLPPSMNCVPKTRVLLGHLNTPIQHWKLPGVPTDVEIFIKRDDMTGAALAGNKVRKLEFLLSEAVENGCTHVATMGGMQSNHCRITSMACARIGLKCSLFLRSQLDAPDVSEVKSIGNVLLDKMSGADIYLLPRGCKQSDVMACIDDFAEKVKHETGEKVYILELGGTTPRGAFGYIDAFSEMLKQGIAERFTDIVITAGGSLEGLAIANHFSGAKLGIHGLTVCCNADAFFTKFQGRLEALGLSHLQARDLVNVIDGHKGRGYGLSTPEELEFIKRVARETGIILDRTYTGKVAKGMVHELCNNRKIFRGNNILFIHTGGLFSSFDGELGSSLDETTDSINVWPL